VIILDTNVLSELTRHTPEADVVAWLDSLPATEVATTSITAAELLYGISRLPDGQRKTSLTSAIHALINEDFHGRVESFDAPAAAHYAAVVNERDKLRRPIRAADAQIAAICRARGAILATRNRKDFEETGVELVNPWRAR
jgi:toxin FitB